MLTWLLELMADLARTLILEALTERVHEHLLTRSVRGTGRAAVWRRLHMRTRRRLLHKLGTGRRLTL